MASPARRLHALLAGAALVLAVAWTARRAEVRAGDYHEGTRLDCSECHVMHTGPREPAARRVGALLRTDVNELCLACHDGSTRAADVLGRNQGRAPGDVRQAGFLNALGRDGLPATGHTLYALDTAPGSDPPWSAPDENGAGRGLSCTNCHAPHGSAGGESAYRNLRSDAGNNRPGEGLVTYNAGHPGSNDLARDVYVRRALSYDESAVDFNAPEPRDSAMARFCAGCHDRFHGLPGIDANIGGRPLGRGLTAFVRHPSSGVGLGALGGDGSSAAAYLAHANRVKVLSSTGAWDAPGAELSPTCISCHKAHGNDNAFGLIYRSGRGAPSENGDSQGRALEDLCGQCHPASPFVP